MLNDERKNILGELILYIVLTLLSLGLGYYSLGKGFDFDICPSVSGGDGTFGLEGIKSVQESGIAGIYFNSRIGAPDGSSLIDFPASDLVMNTIIYLISLFTLSVEIETSSLVSS